MAALFLSAPPRRTPGQEVNLLNLRWNVFGLRRSLNLPRPYHLPQRPPVRPTVSPSSRISMISQLLEQSSQLKPRVRMACSETFVPRNLLLAGAPCMAISAAP